MEDMEYMERIFEIRMDIDCCESVDDLNHIKHSIQGEYDEKIKLITKLFKEEKYEDIKKEIEETKYVEKMLEEISVKEDHIKHAQKL